MSTLARVAAGPRWLLQLGTGAKSFELNPLIGSPRLNRWGLHAKRVELASRLASARRAKLSGLVSDQARAAFERDGFMVRRNVLSEEAFARLRHEIETYRGPILEKSEGRTVLRKVTVNAELLAQIPSLGHLRDLPDWQGPIRYVGGRDQAPAMYLQGVLQQATVGEDDPQTALHADTFHSTVKAWLFLTDVDEASGPFTYVPGSHRLTPQRLAWERRMSLDALNSPDFETRQGSFRIDETELERLGLPRPVPVAVPANTLVVADTFGFHARGRSLRPSTRVEVWGIGQRNPFVHSPLLNRVSGALGSSGRTGTEWAVRTGLSIFEEAREPVTAAA